MKRIIRFLFLGFIICLAFVSCNQEELPDISDGTEQSNSTLSTSYEKFVYRLEHDKMGSNNAGMPLKVNLNSGKTTTACIDPLCMHDTEDCPFNECMGSMIDGEVIFFKRGQMLREQNGYTGTEKLCTYHVATGKMHVLEEYTDSLVFLGVFDDVLYYYTAVWEKSGNDLICTYHLHRADGKTGKVTDLTLPETYRTIGGYTDNGDYPNILMIDGETIYWYKYAEDMTATFYTSDFKAGNWTKLEDGVKTFANIYHNGYGYSIGADMEMIDPDVGFTKDNFKYSYYITRKKLGSAETERIAENIGSSNFIVTDKYIYTMEKHADAPPDITYGHNQYTSGQTVVMGSSAAAWEIMEGCRIWRMNHDGSERVLIAETDEYYFVQEQQYTNDNIMFGYYEDDDRAYLAFFYMEKNEKGKLDLSANTLILDTVTGEFSVSEYIS